MSEIDRLRRVLGSQVQTAPIFATAMFGYNLTKPPFAGNPKAAFGAKHRGGSRNSDELRRAWRRSTRVQHYASARRTTRRFRIGRIFPTDARHALARKLYQEAGYSDEHPLEVVLTYASSGPHVRRFMEALSAMWQMNLGAKVQIYNEEWKVFLQARQLKQPTFYWDAWSGDFPDPFTFMQLFQTGFGMNDQGL